METLKFKDMQFRSKVKVENPDTVTSLSRILVTPQKLTVIVYNEPLNFILRAAVTASRLSPSTSASSQPPSTTSFILLRAHSRSPSFQFILKNACYC